MNSRLVMTGTLAVLVAVGCPGPGGDDDDSGAGSSSSSSSSGGGVSSSQGSGTSGAPASSGSGSTSATASGGSTSSGTATSTTSTTGGSTSATSATSGSTSSSGPACVDHDGDGVAGTGADCGIAADCDDNDNTVWQMAHVYTDRDHDGWTVEPMNGPLELCYGATLPAEYHEGTQGQDCDDTDPDLYQESPLYTDQDGDGWTVEEPGLPNPVCHGATLPAGMVETSAGKDCSDADAALHNGGMLYTDHDGDGWTVEPPGNPVLACFGDAPPAGMVPTSAGQDCDDNQASYTTTCPAALVKDIDARPANVDADAAPHGFTLVPGLSSRLTAQALFLATSTSDGTELWTTDGSARGTHMVLDLVPGPGSPSVLAMAANSSNAWFMTSDGTMGALWVTDGTAAGTTRVLSNLPLPPVAMMAAMGTGVAYTTTTGSGGTVSNYISSPTGTPVLLRQCWGSHTLAATSSRIYFQCGQSGSQLPIYVSDGTQAGTADSGIGAGGFGVLMRSLVVGSTFYALVKSGYSGTSYLQLWKHTTAGATKVWESTENSCSTDFLELAAVGTSVYFTGEQNGCELFRYNGTGAARVKELDSAANNTLGPRNLTSHSSALYFTLPAGNKLWKSDGTAAGTVAVATIRPSGDAQMSHFKSSGGRLYFTATDGPATDVELWSFDGTTAARVADFVPGTAGGANPTEIMALNSNVVMNAKVAGGGQKLVVSDGTSMTVVNSIRRTTYGSSPYVAGSWNSKVFLGAKDGVGGVELWVTDGTTAGTTLVKDINPGTEDSMPSAFLDFGDHALFVAKDGYGVELWSTDGTPGGTAMLADINPGAPDGAPNSFTRVGSKTYFVGTSDVGAELWSTDGTASGTALVKDIRAGVDSSSPASLVALGNVLGFTAANDASGRELWRSDGTVQGTYLVKEIAPGTEDSTPHNLVVFNNALYFSAGNTTTGPELWKSDLTPNGTALLKEISAGATGGDPAEFTVLGNKLLFTAADSNGRELWVTDGTANGTVPVKDIRTGATGSNPHLLTLAGNRVFFVANDGSTGDELWATDGTAANTLLAKDITPGAQGSGITEIRALGDRVFFDAPGDQGIHELWVSDGTGAGTVVVKDLVSIPGMGSQPRMLFPLESRGRLVFTAWEPTRGVELWRTDGTAAGTAVLHDLAPGPAGSNPAVLGVYNGLLYFTGENGSLGRELWGVRVVDIP